MYPVPVRIVFSDDNLRSGLVVQHRNIVLRLDYTGTSQLSLTKTTEVRQHGSDESTKSKL